jgi:hypothetical protein
VKQQISNPPDKLIKQLLGEPENAADFAASNLPAEVARGRQSVAGKQGRTG